jgi:hypothetical protein
MIPLVGFKKELDLQAELVHRVAKEVMAEQKVKLNYVVGTMIEVPRGALTADEIAQTAEFFQLRDQRPDPEWAGVVGEAPMTAGGTPALSITATTRAASCRRMPSWKSARPTPSPRLTSRAWVS